MQSNNQNITLIEQTANAAFQPIGLKTHCHEVTSERKISTYYLYLDIPTYNPVILRAYQSEEMLIKVSLLKDALCDINQLTKENFMPAILEHLVNKEKTNHELAIILFELEINFQLFSRVLEQKRNEEKNN